MPNQITVPIRISFTWTNFIKILLFHYFAYICIFHFIQINLPLIKNMLIRILTGTRNCNIGRFYSFLKKSYSLSNLKFGLHQPPRSFISYNHFLSSTFRLNSNQIDKGEQKTDGDEEKDGDDNMTLGKVALFSLCTIGVVWLMSKKSECESSKTNKAETEKCIHI